MDPMKATRRAYTDMLRRMRDPRHPAFRRYGGRRLQIGLTYFGVRGWEHFLSDLGPRPSPAHSIDRANNDLGYIRGNVRWATAKQQAMNRRNARPLTWKGETKRAAEWAAITGIPLGTIKRRLHARWSVERALSTPPNAMKRRVRKTPEPTITESA
jgi:hypothetical protein